MIFTKYYFKSPLNNIQKQYYLLHTVLASIDVLSDSENEIINKWITCPDIVPSNEDEQKLYNSLLEKGYITTTEKDLQLYNQLKEYCQKKHELLMQEDEITVFTLTYQCNFKCPYCFEQKNNSSVSIMTPEMVDKIFEINNNSVKNINFYGGEPFLPCNYETIKYIIKKAPTAKYSAITNGYYLDKYIDLLKNVDVNYIQITLDGDELIHNQTRILKNNQPTFNVIMQNIDTCLNHDIPVKIRMNISDNNLQSCINLRKQLANKYCDKPIMFELQPIFQLDISDRNQLENKIQEEDASLKPLFSENSLDYNTILYSHSPIMAYLIRNQKTFYPICNNCDAESCRRFYDADGNIYSCILSVGNKKAAIGTYYPTYQLKDNSLITRSIFSIKQCQQCKLAFLCGGGCGYAVGKDTGDMNQPNCLNIMNNLTHQIPTIINEKLAASMPH